METYIVRVWLPDRPGALGQVASRIGAVCGEIVGIDILVGATDRAVLLDAVVSHGRRVLGGVWAAVIRLDDGEVLAVDGNAPPAAWVVAFVEGSRSSAAVMDDVVWAPLPASDLALVVGRTGSGFRARERRQVSALARIADTRLVDFCRRSHPSQA